MARYPGAIWRPITANKSRQRLSTYNRVNLHSTASSAASQFGYFNQSGIPDSHFHVAYDGTVEQYVDTSMQAFADLEGNDATVSIETAGVAKDGNEKWTAAQLASIIKLVAWIMKTHNISRKLASNSKVGTSSHGLSWHRLGCDGNFPALPSIQAGRNQRGGGMRYTKHFGKICPGYGRVIQIHQDVWPAVQRLLSGGTAAPVSPEKEGFLMALSDKAQEDLADTVRKLEVIARRSEDRQRELIVTARAQTAALEALAASVGVDPAGITKAVSDAVAKALKGIEVTLTTE